MTLKRRLQRMLDKRVKSLIKRRTIDSYDPFLGTHKAIEFQADDIMLVSHWQVRLNGILKRNGVQDILKVRHMPYAEIR